MGRAEDQQSQSGTGTQPGVKYTVIARVPPGSREGGTSDDLDRRGKRRSA